MNDLKLTPDAIKLIRIRRDKFEKDLTEMSITIAKDKGAIHQVGEADAQEAVRRHFQYTDPKRVLIASIYSILIAVFIPSSITLIIEAFKNKPLFDNFFTSYEFFGLIFLFLGFKFIILLFKCFKK